MIDLDVIAYKIAKDVKDNPSDIEGTIRSSLEEHVYNIYDHVLAEDFFVVLECLGCDVKKLTESQKAKFVEYCLDAFYSDEDINDAQIEIVKDAIDEYDLPLRNSEE